MSEKLTLIQGMKKLKLIEKKITDNFLRIQEYAALPSTLKPQYGTDEEQRNQVKSLVQSNLDLGQEYLRLKRQVDMTNLKTIVTIGKVPYTLADLLTIRRKVGKLMETTFQALNDKTAEMKVAQTRTKDVQVHIERYYNEADKYTGLQAWTGLQDEIEQRLETINAVTELVDL